MADEIEIKTAEPVVDSDVEQFMDEWEGEREKKEVKAVVTKPVAEKPLATTVTAETTAVKDKNKMPADLSAEILVGAVDTTNSLVFGAIHKRKMRNRFEPAEIDKCVKFNQQIEDKEILKKDLSDTDYDLLYRYNNLQEVGEDIPFTDEEYIKLKKPLAQLIEINGYDIPPGIALTIAVAQILAPRVCDAFFE